MRRPSINTLTLLREKLSRQNASDLMNNNSNNICARTASSWLTTLQQYRWIYRWLNNINLSQLHRKLLSLFRMIYHRWPNGLMFSQNRVPNALQDQLCDACCHLANMIEILTNCVVCATPDVIVSRAMSPFYQIGYTSWFKPFWHYRLRYSLQPRPPGNSQEQATDKFSARKFLNFN